MLETQLYISVTEFFFFLQCHMWKQIFGKITFIVLFPTAQPLEVKRNMIIIERKKPVIEVKLLLTLKFKAKLLINLFSRQNSL